MIVRCLILLLVASAGFAQSKVGTVEAHFLKLSPSARSNGMGQVGVVLTGVRFSYHNPAAVGFFDDRYFAVSFYPEKADLRGDSSLRFNSFSSAVSVPVNSRAGSFPVSLGIAYQQIHLTGSAAGERTYGLVGNSAPGAEGVSTWKDRTDLFTVGVSSSWLVDVGLGLTFKHLSEDWNDGSTSGHAFDFGLLVRAPLAGKQPFLQESEIGSSWRWNLMSGISFSNYGPDIEIAGHEYPLPKLRRIGIGMELGHTTDSIVWLSLIPAVEWETWLAVEHTTVSKFGVEVGLAEALFLRVGTVYTSTNAPGFDTYGLGITTRGVKKMLLGESLARSGSGFDLARLLLSRLNVELSFASSGPTAGDTNTGYYQIDLTL